jgi:predicted enzyme related to lactoylglutathione lyase
MADIPYGTMANIAYFQVPADDIGRARKFYQSLLGWRIEPDTTHENQSLQWQNIITGEPEEGAMNKGGLYKRMGPGPIMNFVILRDFDRVLSRVEKLGGKIVMPKNAIKSVGLVAVIQDTEGNIIGLLKPE